MDPWLTELAKAGPVAGVLGAVAFALWRRLLAKDAQIDALREQQRQDLKESSKELLESARLMESIIRKAKDGRSLSPFPSSNP